MIINTNTFSIHAQRQIEKVQGDQQVAMERLSSGERINQAADDAYGAALNEKYVSHIAGLEQGMLNASNGTSLLQVTNGGLDSVADALQRMRELSLQSASGTYNQTNREQIQQEFKALQEEIERIVHSTTYNGMQVLNRAADAPEKLAFQIGNDNAGATTIGYFHGAAMEIENWGGVSRVEGAEGPNDTAGSFAGASVSLARGDDAVSTLDETASFSIAVDGKEAVNVTVPPATRSNQEWAAELEGQINNSLSNQGSSVTVAYSSDNNNFTITSGSRGSASQIEISTPNREAITQFGLMQELGTAIQGTGEGAPASLTGSTIGNGLQTVDMEATGVFSITVDGIYSGQIELAAAEGRTKTDWAQALQNEINQNEQLQAGGASVTVTYDTSIDAYTMTSNRTGESSSINMLSASDEMAALGFRNSSQASVISLQGLSEAERQITFATDGEEQIVTLPAVVKTPEAWADHLQEQLPTTTVTFDEALQQLQVYSNTDGYGSLVHFSGEIAALGFTENGETFNGYGDINKVSVTHFDLDNQTNVLGSLLVNGENIASQENAANMVEKIDQAFDFVNGARAEVGAVQNRMDRAIEQMNSVESKFREAKSYINDADFAAESAEMAKNQILHQASIAMMAQSNKLPAQMLQTMLR